MTHDGEEYKDGVIIFPFIAIIFGLLLDGVNKKLKFLNIPDSVLQFVFALVASVFICWCLPADMIHVLDKWTWRGMAPDIVLTVIQPSTLRNTVSGASTPAHVRVFLQDQCAYLLCQDLVHRAANSLCIHLHSRNRCRISLSCHDLRQSSKILCCSHLPVHHRSNGSSRGSSHA